MYLSKHVPCLSLTLKFTIVRPTVWELRDQALTARIFERYKKPGDDPTHVIEIFIFILQIRVNNSISLRWFRPMPVRNNLLSIAIEMENYFIDNIGEDDVSKWHWAELSKWDWTGNSPNKNSIWPVKKQSDQFLMHMWSLWIEMKNTFRQKWSNSVFCPFSTNIYGLAYFVITYSYHIQ